MRQINFEKKFFIGWVSKDGFSKLNKEDVMTR